MMQISRNNSREDCWNEDGDQKSNRWESGLTPDRGSETESNWKQTEKSKTPVLKFWWTEE